MDDFVKIITEQLVKYYSIRVHVAEAIVEDEWEYIEEEYFNTTDVSEVTKNLLELCMVA